MFIYLDESGCPGMKLHSGASPFFTLAAIVFPNQDAARQGRRCIADLRVQIGFHPEQEFKYNRTDKRRKQAFFEAIQSLDFKHHSFTLNKSRLVPGALSDSKKLYRKVANWTLSNILDTLACASAPTHASLLFDSCGERAFYDVIEKYVQNLAEWKLKNNSTMRVLAADSKNEDLLQLADMVCGAIGGMRKGCPKGAEYVRMIASKQATMRCWP